MPRWEISSRDASRPGTFCSYQPDPDFPIAWEFAAADAGSTRASEQPASSGDPAPARADHPQAAPVVLEVSPFSLAERTAFVGRETERSAIRAVIDRALSRPRIDGHALGRTRRGQDPPGDGDGGVRVAQWLPMLRRALLRKRRAVSLISRSPRSSKAIWRRRRAWMTTVGRWAPNAAELAQIAPSLRRVFPDIPQPLELPPAQQRRYLFQSLSEALARAARTRPQLVPA